MTRAHTKKAREALNQMVTTIIEAKTTIEDLEDKMVNCIKPLGGWAHAMLLILFSAGSLICNNKIGPDLFYLRSILFSLCN